MMTLFRDSEIPHEVQGLWCRQSRVAGVVRFIVFSGVLAAAPILGWTFHKPWVLWIGTAVAAVLVPLLVTDVAKMFRATNWVLRIGPDGVWINLRSYRHKVSDAASVVCLEYREIASAGQHTESYSTPSEMAGPGSHGAVGGSTIWRDKFLEIRLNHEQTDELQAAMDSLRHQAVPGEGPTGPAPVRSGPFPLWLVNPAVLRIAWVSGHGHVVAPRMARALAHLDGSVRVAEPTRRERRDWRKLNADEVDELARELVHVHGATFEATALLVRAGGMTNADATTLIGRIEQERVGSAEHRG